MFYPSTKDFFLVKISRLEPARKMGPLELSSLVALLKSLSPAGNRFGPMLSIWMQGFLFWLFHFFFRGRILGEIVGMAALSLWAFVQPLITLYLMLGSNLETLFTRFYGDLTRSMPTFVHWGLWLVGALVALKIILACAIPIVYRLRPLWLEDYQKVLCAVTPRSGRNSCGPRSIFSLKFLPVLSLALGLIFWAHFESDYTKVFWLSLRPLSVYFLLFYLAKARWSRANILVLAKRSKRFRKMFLRLSYLGREIFHSP